MNEPAERVSVSCRIARSAVQIIRPDKQGGKGRQEMKTTINKCDRCKKAVDALIDIRIINRNVEEEKGEKEPDSFLASMWGKSKSYPTLDKEVCIECATGLCRWLDHSENLLLHKKVRA